MNEVILQEISEFCRQRGLAESTFGRRAVNDGKLASRLRNGGRITTDTLERIRSFMARNVDAAPVRRRVLFDPPSSPQRWRRFVACRGCCASCSTRRTRARRVWRCTVRDSRSRRKCSAQAFVT